MALTQAERDSKRKTALVRIEVGLLNIIRKFAKQDERTVKATIERVLREKFVNSGIRK